MRLLHWILRKLDEGEDDLIGGVILERRLADRRLRDRRVSR